MEILMASADLLRRLRDDLPMTITITALGRGGPPSKLRDGRFCFLCPHCGEMLAYVNPRNNYAHCFACNANINNIGLMRSLGYDFLTAVEILERWLTQHESRRRPQPLRA